MQDTDAAWLAGLIDGEGAIWCRWPKRTNVVIELKMTHLPTLEKVKELAGGRLVKGHLSPGSWSKKPQYRWSLDTIGAGHLLLRVGPYLVTKKEAALAAIQLCWRPIDSAHMDKWSAALRLSNL